MVDYLPPVVFVPVALVLWAAYVLMVVRSRG